LSLLDDLPFGSLGWTVGTSTLSDLKVNGSSFVVSLLGDLVVWVSLQLLHVLVHGRLSILFELLEQQFTGFFVLFNHS